MKKSRTVRPPAGVESPTTRSLPLVELLIDTEAELFDLAVRSGLQVLDAMLKEDRTAICGPRYAHQADRTASRAGTLASTVVLGGRNQEETAMDGATVAVELASMSVNREAPRFSWTRIKGESDVEGGGGGHGWVEAREGSGVSADGAALGSGALAPGQRWSASRKRDVVLRLLRGESLDAVSREVGLEVYRLEAWKTRALAGMELGLKAQAGEPLAAELDAAKRHIGELSMEIELLRERARAAERRLPLATRRSRR